MNDLFEWMDKNRLATALIVVLLLSLISSGWGISSGKSNYYDDYYGGLTARIPGSVSANSAMTNPSSNYTGGNSLLVLSSSDDSVNSPVSCAMRRKAKEDQKKTAFTDEQLASQL